MGYEVSFSTPWHEGSGGLLHIEHVNMRAPSHEPIKQLYFEILGCGIDERKSKNIIEGTGTLWANIGTTQFHLPQGDAEVIPGIVGLVYHDLSEVRSRLEMGHYKALDDTKFGWSSLDNDTVDVTCPHGNVLRLHRQHTAGAQPVPLDPRGGRFPSPPSLGLGIAYVHFKVKPGTTAGIGRFYQQLFGAEVRHIGSEECSAIGFAGVGGQESPSAGVLVRVGPSQHLGFFESQDPLPEWDGHHLCLYVSDEGLKSSFEEADRQGIVWINPVRSFSEADTLEKAFIEKQYRIKNMVDPASGELLHVLEHEIRSESNPSYPVGREVSA